MGDEPPPATDEASPAGLDRDYLAAVVETSRVAILSEDLAGRITSWNPGAEAMFGYAADEIIGQPTRLLAPEGRRDEIESRRAIIGRGERVELETLRRTRDGRLIEVMASAAPIRDRAGRITGAALIVRDISALKKRERELEHLSRLYAAILAVNRAILRAQSLDELFSTVCTALVDAGRFQGARVAWCAPGAEGLTARASAGTVDDLLDPLAVAGDDPAAGPSVTAFRTGKPCLMGSPSAVALLGAYEQDESAAVAAFPIRCEGTVRGTLSVQGERRRLDSDTETDLLTGAAAEVSFAMATFARDEERHRAEETLRSEMQFSDTMIESMPGIVYFYDDEGRFLRWNRNFELVSGYSGDEIAAMRPLDFFSEEVREAMTGRILEVFDRGEAWIEAPFLAKDGTTKPYFFTGRRVSFAGRPCLVGVGIDVSDRKRAEEQVAASESKYRELVESANSIILRWDAGGRITFLNDFGLRFFGYTADRLLGRHVVGTIVPQTEESGRNLQRLIDDICARPKDFEQSENENVRSDGERVWIAWTNRIVREPDGSTGFLSVGIDITARKRAEARLQESEARLIEAQRIAGIGDWELDASGSRLRFSGQVGAILGLDSLSEGSFQALLDCVHPADRNRAEGAIRAALGGAARLDIELRVVGRDGGEKVVHMLANHRPGRAGAPAALAGTMHDITDRARAAAERERRLRAEAADRVKSSFLATMSHELRTPLNSIIGFTGVILQGLAGPLNPEQHKQLEMVRGSARHLLALVNDVLDISKIEAGQLEVAQLPFDLRGSIAKVLDLVRPMAVAKQLDLVAHLSPSLGRAVGDQRRFEQIVLNLLTNAIKFTERGRIGLDAHIVPGPGTDADEPAVQVRVSDTGIGIKPDDMLSLFQPFRQIDSGLSRSHEGTGLGLAICRRLAALMAGSVTAESTWGKGSTFTVQLPLNGRSRNECQDTAD